MHCNLTTETKYIRTYYVIQINISYMNVCTICILLWKSKAVFEFFNFSKTLGLRCSISSLLRWVDALLPIFLFSRLTLNSLISGQSRMCQAFSTYRASKTWKDFKMNNGANLHIGSLWRTCGWWTRVAKIIYDNIW